MYKQRKFKKPSVHEVTVLLPEHGKKNLEVHFVFDEKILKHMQTLKVKLHAGRYNKYPVPHWEFPLEDQREICDFLKAQKLYVRIFKRRDNFPQDADVISVFGFCKECKRRAYIDRDGLCVRCK